MNKKLIAITFAFLFVASLLLAKNAKAIVRCETQYEGEVCREIELLLDKKVWDPKNSEFKDNLVGVSANIYKFAPGEEITFRLKIKNVGDEKFDKVYVKDTLPDYFELVSGDLEFEIDDLDPDEEVEREFKVRVKSVENLPNESPICDTNTTNRAKAWSGDEVDEDSSQVCIARKVLAAELPPTGPQNTILLLGFSLLSGLTGISLIKRSI